MGQGRGKLHGARAKVVMCAHPAQQENRSKVHKKVLCCFFLAQWLPPFFTTVSALDKNLEKNTV